MKGTKAKQHAEVKAQILRGIHKAYGKAVAGDKQYQANKPDFMKEIDKHVDEALRLLFT